MPDCLTVDPLITPYVDGDIGAGDRRLVDEHLRACPPCHSRVAAERAVRDLVHTRRAALSAAAASPALRDRCAALTKPWSAPANDAHAARGWRVRFAPLAIAASLVIVVGGAFLYVATDRSTRLLAAELTADHVKCFGVINTLVGASADVGAIETAMITTFGWRMHVPEAGTVGLELVGARPCLYAKGRVAHLMYRHKGHPMSVFMVPDMTRPTPPGAASLPGSPAIKDEIVDVMGHEAAVWSSGGRTFVVVADEPQADMAQAVAYVQAALK